MIKQRVDIGALEENINAILATAKKESEVEDLECVEELTEVPKEKKRPPAGISPKSCQRSRYEFPSSLRALKADRPGFVKMSVPERLAPKSFTHTIAQEYAWACTFVGDMHTVQDGSVSGSWARLVEVMAGSDSPMMKEANLEMRETNLRVCCQMLVTTDLVGTSLQIYQCGNCGAQSRCVSESQYTVRWWKHFFGAYYGRDRVGHEGFFLGWSGWGPDSRSNNNQELLNADAIDIKIDSTHSPCTSQMTAWVRADAGFPLILSKAYTEDGLHMFVHSENVTHDVRSGLR
jgi:hypothetical protein